MDRAMVCMHRECWEDETCVLHLQHHKFKVSECKYGHRSKGYCILRDITVPVNICKQGECEKYDSCMDRTF